jgi:multiple antibiotic resistance protein
MTFATCEQLIMSGTPLSEYVLLTTSALFISVNPVAVVPAFLVMTEGDSTRVRTRIAALASVAAGLVLAFFAFAGTWILKLFGLSLPAIQIAGSIVLLCIALDMVNARRSATQETGEETNAALDKESIALTPLAVPMLADPGAISTTFIMLNKAANIEERVAFYICLVAVILVTFLVLMLSVRVSRRIGPIGQKMMGRLMGLLLCAMAVQFTINALRQMGVPLNFQKF